MDRVDLDRINRVAEAVGRELDRSAPAPESTDDPLAVLEAFVITDEQVEKMQATRMICRGLIAHQHLIGLLGPAGSGKTAIATSVLAADLARSFRVWFFQEDASAGDLPRLHEHATKHGYRVLSSVLSGKTTQDQLNELDRIARADVDLSESVFIFDTLKKFCDLMSKGGTRAFLTQMRALTLRGATVVLLGHTNKHRGPDGKLVFEGVGDVRNDVDDLFYIEAGEKGPDGCTTVTISPDKARCQAREVSFRLDTSSMEATELPRVVNVAAELAERQQRERDADLIDAITSALRLTGGMAYSELIDRVRADTGRGKNAVAQVVLRYLSDEVNDDRALWFETRLRVNNMRRVSLRPGGSP
jgi:hypothetical protein